MFGKLAKFFPYYNPNPNERSKCIMFESGMRMELKTVFDHQKIHDFLNLGNKCRIYEDNSKAEQDAVRSAVPHRANELRHFKIDCIKLKQEMNSMIATKPKENVATDSFISINRVKQMGLPIDSLPSDLVVSTPTDALNMRIRNTHLSLMTSHKSEDIKSWKPRLIERFSPERKRISWEGEILDEDSRVGEKWQFWAVDTGENFEEKRERRAFQEQGALGLILELEKRDSISRMERVVG
ncbi:hypothetical protein Lal_00035482 [Lupinus albus]|nr:hypothetical protein Lal_00035482 [Lupinus albus]